MHLYLYIIRFQDIVVDNDKSVVIVNVAEELY